MKNVKRYVLTVDLYVHAKNDKDAFNKSKTITDTLNSNLDCNASIVELGRQSFGSLEYKKVKVK